MSHAGVLTGLHGLESRRRLEAVPFVTPTATRDVSVGSPTDSHVGYGADLRVGVTSNLTADLTYKTDFAQVEADQEVVNLSRFSLFFPEKRQFFTESAGIYDFGQVGNTRLGSDAEPVAGLLQVFYSRRIGLVDGREVPILGGGKITGRAGRYTIGALNIETDSARLRDEGGRPLDVPRANYTAVRVKRDILSKSSVGVIALDREGGRGSAYNRTLGFDTGLMFGSALTVSGIFAKTFTPELSGRDVAGAADVAWTTDRFNAAGTYLDVGTQFNAEMGFIPRRDIRNTRLKAGWTPRPGWRGVRQLAFTGSTAYFEDHAGHPDSRDHTLDATATFNDSSTAQLTLYRSFDRLTSPFTLGPLHFPEGGYDWARWRALYSSNQSKRVYGSGKPRTWRLLQRQPRHAAPRRQFPAEGHAALRAELHAEHRNGTGTADVHDEHREHARQLFLLTRPVREGVPAIQRRSQAGQPEPSALVHLPSRQRLLHRLQPGVGHGPARPERRSRPEPIAHREADVLAVSLSTSVRPEGFAIEGPCPAEGPERGTRHFEGRALVGPGRRGRHEQPRVRGGEEVGASTGGDDVRTREALGHGGLGRHADETGGGEEDVRPRGQQLLCCPFCPCEVARIVEDVQLHGHARAGRVEPQPAGRVHLVHGALEPPLPCGSQRRISRGERQRRRERHQCRCGRAPAGDEARERADHAARAIGARSRDGYRAAEY